MLTAFDKEILAKKQSVKRFKSTKYRDERDEESDRGLDLRQSNSLGSDKVWIRFGESGGPWPTSWHRLQGKSERRVGLLTQK